MLSDAFVAAHMEVELLLSVRVSSEQASLSDQWVEGRWSKNYNPENKTYCTV